MGIYCNNFYTNFATCQDVYANTLSSNQSSNIEFHADINVVGDVFSRGRVDTGLTIFACFRLTSNVLFEGTELFATSNTFTMDIPRTNMYGMESISSSSYSNIYNPLTGEITLPVNGLYSLTIQGVFANTPSTLSSHRNGVYFYFTNQAYPDVRVMANVVNSTVVSTSYTGYFLAGDRILPAFYTNDDNVTLVGNNSETFMSFSLLQTTTPDRTKYHRNNHN